MILKEEARNIIFEKRKKINPHHFKELNTLFYRNFLSVDCLRNIRSKIIAGYCAFADECNIFETLSYCYQNNLIVLPSIIEKNKKMIFREWSCVFDELVVNGLFKKKMILEPGNSCRVLEPDIVFVPAVAVDVYGSRVGHGAGYYDKTLSNLNCVKIATVYDFQIFDTELENTVNDIKMDYILTERRFIKKISK